MAIGPDTSAFPFLTRLAEARSVRDALLSFTRDKQWINDQHLQLCRIPAATFLEQKRAEWMAEQFRALGCEAEIDRAGNVIARPEPDRGRPLVALTAHLDTVLAPRRPEEMTLEPDGSFRGPGVCDNGAGLAALLAIARAFKTLSGPPPPCALILVANVGEEGEGNLSGMRYLCQASPLAPRIESFLVLDGPGTERITHQALASRRFEVLVTGPGGHSWSDFGNGNPVHALSHAITLFSEKCAANGASRPGGYSFNFGVFEGGSSVNSIPSNARTKVDFRSTNLGTIDGLAERLSSTVEQALKIENQRAVGGRLTATLKEIGSRPGGQLPEDAPIMRYLRAVDAHLGIRARLDCASTDANVPLSMGRPAISIGAGGRGGGAHSTSEWYHPEARDLGLTRILLTVLLLLHRES